MKPYILSGVPACEILKISPREYPSERRIHPNTPKKSDCDSRSPNPHATIGSDAENAWRHANRRRCFGIFARPWLLDGAAWIDCAFSRFASRASLAAQKRGAHLAQMVEARLNFDGELRRRKFDLSGLRSGALRNRPDPAGIAPVSYPTRKFHLRRSTPCLIPRRLTSPGVRCRYFFKAVVKWLWLEKLRRVAISPIGISVSRKHRSASSSLSFIRY